MNITITIPDNKKDFIIDKMALKFNYQAQIPDLDPSTGEVIIDASTGEVQTIPNPESKGAFAKKQFIRLLKQSVKDQVEHERRKQFNTDRVTDNMDIDSINIT